MAFDVPAHIYQQLWGRLGAAEFMEGHREPTVLAAAGFGPAGTEQETSS